MIDCLIMSETNKFERGAEFLRGIPCCSSVYTYLQSNGRHVKRKHYWLFKQNMKKVECYHIGATNTFITAVPVSRNSILKYLISDYETETNLNH